MKKETQRKKLKLEKMTILKLSGSISRLREGGMMPTADTCKSECNQGSCKADPNCVPKPLSIGNDGNCDRRRTF